VTVSGFPSPQIEVEPEEMTEPVRERYDGEPKKFEEGELRPAYVDDLFKVHEQERETVKWLNKTEDFQFRFVVFTLLDRLLHVVDPDDDVIERAYQTIDETTAELVDTIDPDDVLIISDHGMTYDPRGKWLHVHDETQGVWAGTRDFNLETHLDVTPTILDYYDVEMDNPSYEIDEHLISDGEMTEQLKDLGYL
jgi:predicted AlkP superfamily phosphohydrolase/phosphomutase